MKILDKAKAAGKWLGANLWAVIVALVAILGAGIFWGYHRGKVRSLEDEKAIAHARERVAALDAEREVLEESREENADRINDIQEERRTVQEELLTVEHDVVNMDDDELEAAFDELY